MDTYGRRVHTRPNYEHAGNYLGHMQLENYASAQWIKGSGKQSELIDAITGDLIGTTSSGGLDCGH